MEKNNRKCICCNKEYRYCNRCSGFDETETWRMIYCSDNCRQLYHIYDDIKAGKIQYKDAKKRMKDLDTSKLNTFNEPMRSVLTVSMNSEITTNDKKEIKDKPVPKKRTAKK